MATIRSAGALSARIDGATPSDIASGLAVLVADGTLAPGDRLPTVRDMAKAMGVSPATVSTAWQALSGAGTIVSRGRAGSFVCDTARRDTAPHTRRLAGHIEATRLDLSRGTPDPRLLPHLARAFARAAPHAATASYHDDPMLPRLRRLLEEQWPAPEHSLTMVSGALDGIDRTLQQVTRFGDRIVIEQPTFPPLYDLVDAHDLVAVPVAIDAEGIRPESLAEALSSRPRVILLQPRAHNPTGASMTPARAAELAEVIRASPRGGDVIVIEDDHSGAIAQAEEATIATHLPDRTVLIRSFSKSHGPDLRVAALGGPTSVVSQVETRRSLGPWWVPRLIQHALTELLTDGESIAEVSRARAAYASRQRRFAQALRTRLGKRARVGPPDGINAWLSVDDERDAVVSLAAAGIRVAAGSTFYPEHAAEEDGRDRIRVTVGMIAGDVDEVAQAVARATPAD
ncbi:MAG: PLP-dependent aminotransferase family protein [Microbacterium sp.]